jgi:ABC-type multidrug transport system fused ATPase/permease subunit
VKYIKKHLQLIVKLVSSKTINKIKIIILGFTLLSFFDFVGVILLGSVGTIAYRLISGDAKPSKLEIILNDILPINLNTYTLAFALTIIAILFLSFKTICTAFFNYKLINFLSRQESTLSTELFNQVLNSKYRSTIKNSVSQYQWAIMTGSNRLIIGVLVPLLNFISDSLSACLLLFLAIYASPVSTFVVAILLALSYQLFSMYVHKRAAILGKSVTDLNIKLNNLIINSIKGKKEIHLYNLEEKFSSDFAASRLALAKDLQLSQWLNSLFRYFMELSLLFAGIVTVLIQISISDIRHTVTVLIVFIMIGFRLIPSAQRIQSTVISLRISEPMVETFLKYKEIFETEDTPKEKNKATHNSLSGFKITNLDYRNNINEKSIFANLNLEIKPGEMLVVYGESGSGKTTLIDLICGLEEPTNGKIEFINQDGISIDRPNISYVPQTPFVVAGDIYLNIAFGGKQINKKEIDEIIESLNLGKVASRLVNENIKEIVEEGNNLSGGEKQRIGIARAIYSKRNFLVLDEPTSSLDIDNQEKFLDLLKEIRKQKTIIIVTHNPKLLELADQQIILKSSHK